MCLATLVAAALASAGTGAAMIGPSQILQLLADPLGSDLGIETEPWHALVVPIALLPMLARPLNALLLGEREALHLGVSTQTASRAAIALCAVAVRGAVAVSGIIGFVGMVVPHAVRLLTGPDHRWVLPGSMMLGAALLLATDLVARTAVLPAELPIGVVTALIGGPFFVWLIRRRRDWG